MDSRIDFIYLSEPDMIKAGVKDMEKCVETMEDMLVTLHMGDYVMGGANHNSHGIFVMFPENPEFPGMPKHTDDRRFMAMPAYLGGKYQMAGMKWYGSNIENKDIGLPRSILMMCLNDKDTGAPLAFMSANLLSSYRTGAIPGVGAKYLARTGATVASIVGPGVMGKTTLAAFMCTCPDLNTVKIKGRGKKSIDNFVEYIKAEYPQIENIIICETLEDAIRDSDVIAMTASAPVSVEDFPYIKKEWVKKGALIVMPSAGRFDDDFLINDCKKVVENYKLYESSDEEVGYPSFPVVQIIGNKFKDLLHERKIKREDIIDLADVIAGNVPGRESDEDIIIYSVGGMPVEDVAWGCELYRNAMKLGIGKKLNLWEKPDLA